MTDPPQLKRIKFSDDVKPCNVSTPESYEDRIKNLETRNKQIMTELVKRKINARNKFSGMNSEIKRLLLESKRLNKQQLNLTSLLLYIYDNNNAMGLPETNTHLDHFKAWAKTRTKKKKLG